MRRSQRSDTAALNPQLWRMGAKQGWRNRRNRGRIAPKQGGGLCKVVGKISLELSNRLPVDASRSLVGLHRLESVPDVPLRDGKRLCLGHRAPPATGWLWVAAEHCSPFGPVPLQNLPPSYELLRPCAPHRYSDPCGLSRLDVSLCIGATGSHVPYESLIRLRAADMPDVARAVFRTALELIPEAGRPSGFDIIFGISTRHQQFAFARLSGSYLTGLSPAFGCNAHHDRS